MIRSVRVKPDDIGATLQAMRKHCCMTQAEAAGALGLSGPVTISRYETGRRMVSMDVLCNLARLYGFDVQIRLERRDGK